ncbi:MAG: CPBP family intramembrane glutamic endopeptidase [Pirellulaceae bacterium]|nr:CPBP family intramembrane metalloprotease [Planctomycetales bacterium]
MTPSLTNRRLEFLSLAIILVYASHAIPAYLVYGNIFGSHDDIIEQAIGQFNWYQVISLIFSMLLVAHDPAGYGVRIGRARETWKRLVLLCAIPIVLTAIVYPRLESRPFHGAPAAIWLISPLAQDLLFAGYFFEKFRKLFPGHLSARLPFERCIFVTAFFFALWHTPGFAANLGWYIWFQLVYTFFGACLVGLIRQWTGSLLYITVVHMIVNYIAVKY